MTMATFDDALAPVGLGVWAAELNAAAQLAASLALTAFVPASLRVVNTRTGEVDAEATTATVTAALLTGREVGLSPMAALRSIDIVQGTPALRAHALRGLVLSRGHDMWLVESTNTRCIMRGQRHGSAHVQEVSWSMDDARALGIAGRQQWRTQPRTMLRARATADLARLVAPEAIYGLPYITEELDGAEPAGAALAGDEPTDVQPRKRARRTVRPVVDAQLPPRPDTPAPEAAPPADTAEPNDPAPVSAQQLKALHTAMTVRNIVDRTERLAYVSGIIGRDVDSSQKLTSAEASTVLDALRLAALADDEEAPPWPDMEAGE